MATHNRNSIVYGSSKKQFARAPSNSIMMARIAPLPSPFRSYRWLWIYQEGGCAATITHLYKETSSWLAMQTRKIAHNKFGDDSRRCRKTSCNEGHIMNMLPFTQCIFDHNRKFQRETVQVSRFIRSVAIQLQLKRPQGFRRVNELCETSLLMR